ncbi:tyrosinase central domain-containing protein [Coprinopsis cinerea AmutBmut pab1-1]|nr:tyrosinase central domain-containing protein [Coprinopsis cinerea AmutBmut pab1-1]
MPTRKSLSTSLPSLTLKRGSVVTGFPGTYTIPPDPLHLGAIDIYAYGKGCVQSGPFKDYSLTIGPGKLFTSHCLVRNINETYRSYLTSSAIHNLMQQPNYSSFRSELEGIPSTTDRRVHDAGHLVVGGDMGNPYSSPTDPLFFLHHANVDRIWWEWQRANPVKRLYEISGRAITNPPFTNITLDFPLQFDTLVPRPVPVRDVMDIHSEPLCYTYF